MTKKRLKNPYNEPEIWLEQQMKGFWEQTRSLEPDEGAPIPLDVVLRYWSDDCRAEKLQTAQFSDDWIRVLYQRVHYLVGNKTLLGSREDKLHQARTLLVTASLLRQREASGISRLLQMSATCDPAMLEKDFPVFYRGFDAIQSAAAMKSHVLSSGFDLEDKEPSLDVIIKTPQGTTEELHTYSSTTLHEFLDFYRSLKNMPKTSAFRVKYMGKTLFMSTHGKSTLGELNITHRSFVTVTEITPQPVVAVTKKEKTQSRESGKSGTKKKKGGNKKSKKKRSGNCSYESNKTAADDKEEHSKRLSVVFEEVETKFSEIRRRLSNLSLKKTLPKDKKSAAPKKDRSDGIKLPGLAVSLDQQGNSGKVGKSVFPVLVGEVDNLYQSSKKSSKQRLRTFSIDLHGCTGHEAAKKLDKELTVWMDTAMMAEHPFLVKVDIICGGGNQVLSEIVETWIRKNKHVANRPKSFC